MSIDNVEVLSENIQVTIGSSSVDNLVGIDLPSIVYETFDIEVMDAVAIRKELSSKTSYPQMTVNYLDDGSNVGVVDAVVGTADQEVGVSIGAAGEFVDATVTGVILSNKMQGLSTDSKTMEYQLTMEVESVV